MNQKEKKTFTRDINEIQRFWVDKGHNIYLNILFHDEHILAIDTWKGSPGDCLYENGIETIKIDLRTGKRVKGE